MKRLALIGLLLAIALSPAGNVNALVLPEGDKAPALLEEGIPLEPSGTVSSNVPEYGWTSVSGATKYQVKVKKGSKTVFNFEISSAGAGCGAYCGYWPPGILSNKDYKWKVRAYDAGWLPWSAWLKFTVNASGGFKSSFKKNANGWSKLTGKWKIAKGKYVTKGRQGKFATSMNSGNYANFTYEVRMRRVWDGECDKNMQTNIYVRGTPEPLTEPYKEWDKEMRFTYANNEFYAVSRNDAGLRHVLEDGTSGHINQLGWNTLLVVAMGNTYWFYINGHFIKSWIDSSHFSGVVGVGFFQGIGCADKLKVDWVKLSENTPW